VLQQVLAFSGYLQSAPKVSTFRGQLLNNHSMKRKRSSSLWVAHSNNASGYKYLSTILNKIFKGEEMFTLFKLVVVIFAVSFSALSVSQQNIAVVDIDGAVANSNYAKEARKKLESSESFQKKRSRYSELGKELKLLEKDAQTNGLTWSDEQKRKHNSGAQEKLSEINKIGKQLESEVNQINKKMAQELNPKIDEIIKSIIKEKELGILLKAQSVHFATPQFDISKELLERLNKAN